MTCCAYFTMRRPKLSNEICTENIKNTKYWLIITMFSYSPLEKLYVTLLFKENIVKS